MPEKIQRVPRGLGNLLSLQSGKTPENLADDVQSSLDLLQMYGLTMLQQKSATNAALAEAAALNVTLPNSWCVLFAMWLAITKTATMTALRGAFALDRGTGGIRTFEDNMGPFGATETGLVSIAWWPSYPVICPPLSAVLANMPVLGTDATASCTLTVEFGVLG